MTKRLDSRGLARRLRAAVAALALTAFAAGIAYNLSPGASGAAASQERINNNRPEPNPNGASATFSTQGEVGLAGEYFRAQGANGRSCATCHIPGDAWGINPGTLQRLFGETGGEHPVFNRLDADNPEAGDFETVEGRFAAYSMLLSRGVFRRGGAPRADRDWDLVAVEDPHGYASLNRLVHWRRVMPTINHLIGSATINWDGGNSVGADIHAGLVNQAGRNISGAQQGPTPARPPSSKTS